MLCYRGRAKSALQVAIVILPAAITSGVWFSKQFTMHSFKRNACRIRIFYEDASAGRNPQATLAWRWSYGDATHVRRTGTGQLRGGMESHIPRESACHSATLCGGRIGLPHHQYLWRLTHHAQ